MTREQQDKFFRELHSRLDDVEKKIVEAEAKPQPSRTLRGGFTRLIKQGW